MRTAVAYLLRESLLYAYLCGFFERLAWGDGFGRTHATNLDWSEAYDRGANLADRLTGSAEQ